MNTINSKKCPICYSVLSTKVEFCPVCGTELQTQINEKPAPHFSEQQFPTISSSPNKLFVEEPAGTKLVQDTSLESNQYAWRISDEQFLLRMKGQVRYSDTIDIPKTNFSFLKSLGYVNLLIAGFIGLITSFFLLSSIGFSGLIFFYNSVSIQTIILLVISLILFSLSSFFLNRFLLKITDQEVVKNFSSKNILSYLIIHATHIVILGLVTVGGWQITRALANKTSIYSAFYSVTIVLVIIISLFSPPIRIAKLFSNIRSTGLFQNFYEASQIHKLSIKRTIEMIGFSFLLPSIVILGGITSIIKIFGNLFMNESEVVFFIWDIAIYFLVLIIIAFILFYVTIADTRFVSYYESLLNRFVTPPKLNWLSKTQNNVPNSSLSDEIANDDFEDVGLENREFRCPSCSSIIIEGAEFCTDCGKKIVK